MKYHKDLGFPKTLKFPDYVIDLTWSFHAIRKAFKTGIGVTSVLLGVDQKYVVEVETYDNKEINSVVLRMPWNEHHDLCFSIRLFYKTGVVKTIWVNNKKDNHETLDKSKYDLPDNYNSKEIDLIYGGK
jgi:hypothetical protein